jgi:hypothetical protein
MTPKEMKFYSFGDFLCRRHVAFPVKIIFIFLGWDGGGRVFIPQQDWSSSRELFVNLRDEYPDQHCPKGFSSVTSYQGFDRVPACTIKLSA